MKRGRRLCLEELLFDFDQEGNGLDLKFDEIRRVRLEEGFPVEKKRNTRRISTRISGKGFCWKLMVCPSFFGQVAKRQKNSNCEVFVLESEDDSCFFGELAWCAQLY